MQKLHLTLVIRKPACIRGRFMKLSKTGVALLVGAGFAGGIVAAPKTGSLLRTIGIVPAIAQESDASSDQLLLLFGDVLRQVRHEYVEPVSSRTLITNALNGMLTGLDPHSSYLTQQQWHDMQTETRGRFGGIGLQVTDNGGLLEVVSPIDGTPAANAGIKPGDLITAVNGRTVEGLSLNDAVAEMRGAPNTTLQLVIKRQGTDKPIELSLTRQIINVQTVKSSLMGDIGVIRISEFTEQTDPGVRAAIRSLRDQAKGGLRGLVLDLRNDPGGLLDQAVAVSNDFLDSGTIVSTRGRLPEDNHSWTARSGNDVVTTLPIVVLTNNGTASAAEIVAGALQDHHRALVLGTQSFGKGSVQTLIPLDGDGAIRLTTARYYTPSGRSIQGLGITPDVEVQQSQKPEPHFGPEHESDLRHILSNDSKPPAATPPADLPLEARSIPKMPPAGWPAYDAAKPSTDFQLQQGLSLVRALASRQAASR
jgi:carboxyl-terminal processing protease